MVIQMTSTLQFLSKSPKIGLLILVEANIFEFQHEIGKKFEPHDKFTFNMVFPSLNKFNFSNYLLNLVEEYDMFCLVVIIDLQIM
jgi:hypothetical protein